jgi:hypothetical protein
VIVKQDNTRNSATNVVSLSDRLPLQATAYSQLSSTPLANCKIAQLNSTTVHCLSNRIPAYYGATLIGLTNELHQE